MNLLQRLAGYDDYRLDVDLSALEERRDDAKVYDKGEGKDLPRIVD